MYEYYLEKERNSKMEHYSLITETKQWFLFRESFSENWKYFDFFTFYNFTILYFLNLTFFLLLYSTFKLEISIRPASEIQ